MCRNPVVGGFLGATGCLIVLGAVRVITGQPLQFATLGQFEDLQTLAEALGGRLQVMALILYGDLAPLRAHRSGCRPFSWLA